MKAVMTSLSVLKEVKGLVNTIIFHASVTLLRILNGQTTGMSDLTHWGAEMSSPQNSSTKSEVGRVPSAWKWFLSGRVLTFIVLWPGLGIAWIGSMFSSWRWRWVGGGVSSTGDGWWLQLNSQIWIIMWWRLVAWCMTGLFNVLA